MLSFQDLLLCFGLWCFIVRIWLCTGFYKVKGSEMVSLPGFDGSKNPVLVLVGRWVTPSKLCSPEVRNLPNPRKSLAESPEPHTAKPPRPKQSLLFAFE